MTRTVIEGAAIATVDPAGTEYASGHVVLDGDRISAVGPGPAPAQPPGTTIINGAGCLLTPGLINTHHHLYQWATRGLSQDATLFEWLVALYPVWRGLTEDITSAAGAAGLARLARTGTTTVADHHYVFPAGGGDLVAALVDAAERIGTRLHLVRGSMDRGESAGGLPPDELVEGTDEALAGTEAAIRKYHDPVPGARLRIAVGPCSPFSVSTELMLGAAELARKHAVRLHTHLAETLDEDRQCRREFGKSPVDYAESLGWLGDDVWLAHTVHLDERDIARLGATRTGVAHCPTSNGRLGAGIAPVADLLRAGAPVGLGADGAASNESGGLAEEMHTALLFARLRGGPTALTVRQALWLATAGGARCLGRADELGTITPGALADLVLWRLDGFGHAGIPDPVAALVLGPPAPVELVLVGGKPIVQADRLTTVDEHRLATDLAASQQRLTEGTR